MTDSRIYTLLSEAQELIRDQKNWTTRSLARDCTDRPVALTRCIEACRWCALGALHKVTNTIEDYDMLEHFLNQAARQIYPRYRYSVAYINDNNGHQAVMQLFDKAKEICNSKKI